MIHDCADAESLIAALRAERDRLAELLRESVEEADELRKTKPIPMRLFCPRCGELHIDEGEWVARPHHTHACQHCGEVWRPAVVSTIGVRFLPGFKNGETT